MKLSVLRKISLSLDSPIGLYLRLNLSKRWNESECAYSSCQRLKLYIEKSKIAGVTYVHIQSIDTQVIRCKVDAIKDLLQC